MPIINLKTNKPLIEEELEQLLEKLKELGEDEKQIQGESDL